MITIKIEFSQEEVVKILSEKALSQLIGRSEDIETKGCSFSSEDDLTATVVLTKNSPK